MKYQLLILGILAAFSRQAVAADTDENKINLEEIADGIKLTCKDGSTVYKGVVNKSEWILNYHDDNTGEYKCDDSSKIYVKFRTCDNCVELDTASIAGLAVGDVVATIVVGVAVYLIASQARAVQVRPAKKRSDKQNLIPLNERPTEGTYQHLRTQDRDTYDKLRK